MVMTSFNTVNGVPATGNKKLMRGILRDEMGFDGVLISDWGGNRGDYLPRLLRRSRGGSCTLS